MSCTTIFAFGSDGEATDPVEFRNSHFHGPVVWSHLWGKYVDQSDEFGYTFNTQRLLDLQHDERLTDDEWYVFMCGMDNAVVPPQLIDRVCEAYEDFSHMLPEGRLNHSKAYIETMRNYQNNVNGLRGVCWWSTSVTDNPWMVYEEPGGAPDDGGDYRPYSLDKDDRHWFLMTRNEFRASMENK